MKTNINKAKAVKRLLILKAKHLLVSIENTCNICSSQIIGDDVEVTIPASEYFRVKGDLLNFGETIVDL